jgi:anti-sigma B factor antagonist
MAESFKHFDTSVQEGALIVTIKDTHLHGDQLADELRSQLIQALDQSGLNKIILDFQNVEYLSSVAFRPLLSLRRKIEEKKGRMVLCNLATMVGDIFRMLRLISSSRSYPATFEVVADVPAALAALRP